MKLFSKRYIKLYTNKFGRFNFHEKTFDHSHWILAFANALFKRMSVKTCIKWYQNISFFHNSDVNFK